MAESDQPARHSAIDLVDADGDEITFVPGIGHPDVPVRWRGLQFEPGVPLRVRNKWHLDGAKSHKYLRVGPLSDEDKRSLDAWTREHRQES